MGMPVKISDELLIAARDEAKSANRSIARQVEYWASIGRATELLITHRELLGIKSVNDAFPAAPRRDEVHRLLSQLVENPKDREAVRTAIHAADVPVYETDPAHPGQIVRVSKDGTRKVGHFENRRFVPEGGLRR